MVIVEGGARESSVSGSPSSSCGDVDGLESGGSGVEDLIGVIEKAGSYGGYRKTQKKECLNLARRLRLLVPLLEEIGETRHATNFPGDALGATLDRLRQAVVAADKLLKQCHCGSKIYLVCYCYLAVCSFGLTRLRSSESGFHRICRCWRTRQS